MAQTKFKVEDGLLVRGQANVTGALRVEGTTSLVGNVITNVGVGGNVTPTVTNTYYLGNTTNRWIIYASSINTTEPTVITNTATFGNSITLSGNINFTANGYVLGNTTAQVIVNTSNTLVSDTLSVGNNGVSYLVVNSSSFAALSNLALGGTSIKIGNNAAETQVITLTNLSVAPGLPSTIIDEFTKSSYTTAKYIIRATNNNTGDVYASEVMVQYHNNSNTVLFSEYGQLFNSTRFMNLTAVTTDNTVRIVANSSATNVSVRIVRTSIA